MVATLDEVAVAPNLLLIPMLDATLACFVVRDEVSRDGEYCFFDPLDSLFIMVVLTGFNFAAVSFSWDRSERSTRDLDPNCFVVTPATLSLIHI